MMNSDNLYQAVASRLESELGFNLSDGQAGDMARIMIEEIVNHIKENAEVNTETGVMLAASPPAVTPNDGGATLYSAQLKSDINGKNLSGSIE